MLIAAVALMVVGLYATWLWQAERQVRLHTVHFLKAVEGRNWDKVRGLVAEDYSDRWGHDKENVMTDARSVFGHFLFLTIQAEPGPATVGDSGADIRVPVKIAGQGSPIAALVMERVNSLRDPFLFAWRQRSWKPWDWQLVRIDHPQLEIEGDRAF